MKVSIAIEFVTELREDGWWITCRVPDGSELEHGPYKTEEEADAKVSQTCDAIGALDNVKKVKKWVSQKQEVN